jgi:hypothetical protein
MTTRRRASIYILVLAVTTIVTVTIVGGMAVQNSRARAAALSTDALRARAAAVSAVEWTIDRVARTPNWRSSLPATGVWAPALQIDGATVRVVASDPDDASLTNRPGDDVVLTATATAGGARQAIAVTTSPRLTPIDALQAAAVGGLALSFAGAVVTADRVIASNTGAHASGSTIHPRVEVALLATGGDYAGGVTSLAGVRPLPDSDDALAWYIAHATEIPYDSIPGGQIQRTLLGPHNNPFGGGTNPDGIYLIRCAGRPLQIRNARILGTLVVLDAGDASGVDGPVLWTAAVPGYPALLATGAFTLDVRRTLSEATANVNFNPAGFVRGDPGDTDQTDTYPSQIAGLIYVDGDLGVTGEPTIIGSTLATGLLWFGGSPSLRADPGLAQVGAPPGFGAAGALRVRPGTWRPATPQP